VTSEATVEAGPDDRNMTGPDKEQFVLPEEQFDLHQIALEGYVYFYPW